MTDFSPIDERIWIGKVHLIPLPGWDPFPYPEAIGAFTNCITTANCEQTFREKVRSILALDGFEVTEFEEVERLVERANRIESQMDRRAMKEILKLISDEDLEDFVATTEVHTYSELD